MAMLPFLFRCQKAQILNFGSHTPAGGSLKVCICDLTFPLVPTYYCISCSLFLFVFYYRRFPTYKGWTSYFSTLGWCRSHRHSAQKGTTLSPDAGQLPVGPEIRRLSRALQWPALPQVFAQLQANVSLQAHLRQTRLSWDVR